MPAVLNVGGGTKSIPIPPHFAGWRHDILDIDPRGNPEVLANAREMHLLPAATYDAVYCSHNLEHYHRHEAAKVVRGFRHVLQPEGFVQILVPDLLGVMRHVVQNNLDTDDVLYLSAVGPIMVRDVLYGYHAEIERTGSDFFAHKTCFSVKSLTRHMADNGFPVAAAAVIGDFQILGYFFIQPPSTKLCTLLGIQSG